MSELTLTLLRLGLLAMLWVFVFSIVGVLRGDLYGTRVSSRPVRDRAGRARRGERGEGGNPRSTAAGAPAASADHPERGGRFGRPRRRGPTKLVVTEGPLSGTNLPLRDSGTLIGRSPECALVLDDDYASGRHARVHFDGSRWLVEDLGSTNGTWLDGARLTTPEPVDVGSTIRIGRTVLELQR